MTSGCRIECEVIQWKLVIALVFLYIPSQTIRQRLHFPITTRDLNMALIIVEQYLHLRKILLTF